MKKQTKKATSQKPNSTPAPDNKPQETSQASTPAPVTPPPATTEKAKETPKKEKAPSISAAVRRIVVKNPAVTAAEVSQTLIDNGWDPGDVEKRASTIATLRTDALSIIAIAKEEGCWK